MASRTAGLLLLALGLAFSTTYYVSTTGNDTNPGTIGMPWETIGKAAATLVSGDSALVRAGVYKQSLNPARSGTQADPITFAAYDTERVVVECAEVVSGWTQDSANRYRASVNFTCDPRFTTVRDQNGNHGGLVTQDGAKMQYAMEASVAAVDSPGEYYMNDSLNPPFTLYLCAHDLGRGVNPDSYEMKVGRIRKACDLDGGEDYIVLDGIEFRGANDNAIHSIGSAGCEFRDLVLHTNFITGIYLTSGSNGCLIERCAFWDNGHGGVELASTRRTAIRKNRFLKRDLGDSCGGNGAHMWLGPVGALADSNLVENNIAFGTGRYGYKGPFAAVAGSYNIIRHNSMVDNGGGAIALLDGGHNTVVNNACDISASIAHGVAVFPNAARDSFHIFKGNCFYALDPTGKYWWNGVRYSSLAEWESAGVQTGNIDSLPGFVQPDSEDLRLLGGSACVDRGTPDSAASEDYDGVPRPQGAGFDIGAFECVEVAASERPGVRRTLPSRATVVSGVLWMEGSGKDAAHRAELVDVAGRKVMDLTSGPNDVRPLGPGVYFTRPEPGGGPGAAGLTRFTVVH